MTPASSNLEVIPELVDVDGLLFWTGSIIAMVLDLTEEALMRSMISLGMASLIRWLGTEKRKKYFYINALNYQFDISYQSSASSAMASFDVAQ